MKTIIILIFTCLFLHSCTKDNNTNTTEFTPEKFQQILNDSTWYEITDTIKHDILPLDFDTEGIVFNSYNEVRDFFIKTLPRTHFNLSDTSSLNTTPKIDYNVRSLIIHKIYGMYNGDHITRIFRNDLTKKYLSIMEVNWTGAYYEVTAIETYSVPKIPNDYMIDFIHFYSKK